MTEMQIYWQDWAMVALSGALAGMLWMILLGFVGAFVVMVLAHLFGWDLSEDEEAPRKTRGELAVGQLQACVERDEALKQYAVAASEEEANALVDKWLVRRKEWAGEAPQEAQTNEA